jgi:hypothetical protein
MITPADIILFICMALGMLALVCGVVVTNIAVQEMREVLNSNRPPENQLRWHDAIQKVAQNVIDEYRTTYSDGPLYRKLVTGYYMFGIGTVVMIGSAFMLKFVD